jgi:typhasterol/6-deoxotyphasterol 2alpha-hydroxylase
MAKELSMDEVYGLSMTRKFPLKVVIQPRLPTELYG